MFENSLGRKKREELGDQILMKQMHGFKSAECYCSTLGLTAGSEDSLAEAQSCSWKPPGAPFCSPIACPVSGVGSKRSVPSCSSLVLSPCQAFLGGVFVTALLSLNWQAL